jgi:hypothetical protein
VRTRVTALFLLGALAASLALASQASAARWVVRDNAGRAAGSVVNGLNDAGSPCGWLRTGGHVIANVYRVRRPGFDGWMLSPGARQSPRLFGILRVTPVRFALGDTHGGGRTARAVRTAAGYWVLSHKTGSSWTRAGSIPGGCKGAWAAGAAQGLL